jgi:hypothetical protein
MYQNFRDTFRGEILKQQLWKCSRSTHIVQWEEAMEEMRLLNSEAHAWLEELNPKAWARAFQSKLPKCVILLNNNCEIFNKWCLQALLFSEYCKDCYFSKYCKHCYFLILQALFFLQALY